MLYNIDSKEEMLRKRFRPGARVELISSSVAEAQGLFEGSRGTVRSHDKDGSILVRWDNGITTTLIPGIDLFKQLNIDAKIEEAEAVRLANMANQSKKKKKTKNKQHAISADKEL